MIVKVAVRVAVAISANQKKKKNYENFLAVKRSS